MRVWPVIILAGALTALGAFARAQSSSEDCSKHAKQSQQIACLQQAITVLQVQMDALAASRRRESVALDMRLQALIDEKIREAMKPRVQMLQQPPR